MTPLRPAALPDAAALAAIEDAAAPEIRRAFLDAVAALRRGVPIAELDAALAAKDTARALRLVPLDAFQQALATIQARTDAAAAAHRVAASRLSGEIAADAPALEAAGAVADAGAAVARLGVAFDQLSPDVLEAIRTRAAERVTAVTEETKAAIRQVMEDSYTAGTAPRAAAGRIGELAGLTARQAASVDAYRAELEAAGTPDDAAVAAYAQQLTEQRGAVIARTEANAAMNDGQRAAWQDLADRGLLHPDLFVREWITVVAGACDVCAPMDGQTAPVDGDFAGGVTGPPLHPNCRCSEALRLVAGAAPDSSPAPRAASLSEVDA